jgi:hypothetical protein
MAKVKIIMKLCDKKKTELIGPYECECGGHLMLDATFLEQVSSVVTCPYCKRRAKVQGV